MRIRETPLAQASRLQDANLHEHRANTQGEEGECKIILGGVCPPGQTLF